MPIETVPNRSRACQHCGQWFLPYLRRETSQRFCSASCRTAAFRAKERPRLSNQCEAILERLKRGRATNSELARIALKYTGRISELRQAGHDIQPVERDRTTGLVRYALFAAGQEVCL